MSVALDNKPDSDKPVFSGYDIIGDVHGCGDSLKLLLEKLGYVKRDGAYQYANLRKPRQVVFVGDILDRGPKIREALHTVRDMVDKGSAQIVMGNHEYNALAYTTKVPHSNNQYLREHTESNSRLIHETLEQFANFPRDWQDTLAWLYDWPVLLEFDYFRVIHACWDQPLVDHFLSCYPNACIDKDFLVESVDFKNPAGRFMSRATRGPALLLPDNMSVTGSDGYTRRTFRVKFWVENPESLGDVVFQPDPIPDSLVNTQLTEDQKAYIPFYSADEKPLFVGHYWQRGNPTPLAKNVACLDYSAIKNGRLVAYRMDNEKKLSANKFVYVNGHESLVV